MPTIESDMIAVVWKILVAEGDTVQDGDTVMILESMKMEIPIEAEIAGTITKLHVTEGSTVNDGDVLVTLD